MRRHHLLALLLLTGCSFAFARGPGSVGPADCTRGYWLPAADLVLLTPTTLVLGAVGAVGCTMGGRDGCAAQTIGFGLAGVAEIVSGIYGIVAVSHCRATTKPEPQAPSLPERDLACEQRREELQRAAAAEPDLGKRTRLLQALPSC